MSTSTTLPLSTATTRTPTVLVVGPVPPPYHGGSVATSYVLDACRRDQWNVVHIDTSDRRGVDNIGRFDAGNAGLALVHGWRFLVQLLTRRPDVVYVPIAQNTLGLLRDLLFLIPTRVLRRRLIVHVHGGGFGAYYANAPRIMRALLRATISGAEQVVVLGAGLRETLRHVVPPDRVVVLPNGIADKFTTSPDRKATDTLRVLYLGNLIESKGFLDVMRAVEHLADHGVRVHLDIAGAYAGEQERAQAETLRARLGERVTMHGPVEGERKQALFEKADVFVFPTYYPFEGHPYVILEAMSAGLPVISTRHAAIPDTVIHGETGLLVPARDPAALADALETLARDIPLRCRLGAAGRTRFLERYTLDSWSRGLTAVLRGAAS